MFKRIFLLSIAVLCAFVAFSQNFQTNGAALNVFSNQEPFYLYINNVLYNKNPQSKIRVEGLSNYNYNIRVEFESRMHVGASVSRLSLFNELNQALDITYLANKDRHGSNSLVLFSLFPIRANMPNIESFAVYVYGKPGLPIYGQDDYFVDDLMTDKEFRDFMKSLKSEGFDNGKLDVARMVSAEFSLTVAQIAEAMKTFSWDDGKVSFAELMFTKCIDKANYYTLIDLLTFSNAKDRLTDFIKNNSGRNPYINKMSTAEFNNLLKQIKNAAFDSDKTKLISTVSPTVSFSVAQIRTILKTYSFDDGKLDAAKMLYALCSDRHNYYTLLDEFSFLSSKKALQDFISSKR